jgi:hypothetical protein
MVRNNFIFFKNTNSRNIDISILLILDYLDNNFIFLKKFNNSKLIDIKFINLKKINCNNQCINILYF